MLGWFTPGYRCVYMYSRFGFIASIQEMGNSKAKLVITDKFGQMQYTRVHKNAMSAYSTWRRFDATEESRRKKTWEK